MEQIMRMQLCVLVIVFLLTLLIPIGFLRRRCKSVLIKAIAMGIYTSTYLLIPYVLGLMRTYHHDHPFWAVSLVFVYGSVDKVNTFDLNDQASVGLIWVKNFVHFVFALYVAALRILDQDHSRLVSAFHLGCLLYSFYKIAERVCASHYANGNDLTLTSLVLNVSKSLPNGFHVPGSDDPSLGCKYVVNPHYRLKSADQGFITVDKVLNCKDGCILSCTGDPSYHLKNTCLSFSLFWLLLHRFVGVPSYEGLHREEAWQFVKHGMLSRNTSPLTTIEVELTFLYDFFYSKYFVFYLKGLWCQMLKHLVFHGLFTMHAVLHYWRHRIPSISVHKVVIVILIVTELVQFVFFLNSRWSKMMLICTYLERESWKKKNIWDCCIKKAAQLICPIRGEWFRPWQRKLSQYSLLVSSSSSRLDLLWKMASVMTHALAGIQIALPGRKESDGINLTDDIKEAVLQSLWDHGPHLSNGIASLEGNNQLPLSVRRKLVWACKGFSTDAQVILVWHIATSLCEINPHLPQTARDSVDFHVATSLSKYCAYLVAFAPDLLPGNAANTDHICTMAIKDVYTCIKDCESSKRYDRLMEVVGDSDEPEAGQGNTSNVLELGVVLGKVLDIEITDTSKRWKVLADVWAEMMLYLAPNANNEWAHARMLADGGEFITHLWALLFHAGIIDRDFVQRPNVSASSETNTASTQC